MIEERFDWFYWMLLKYRKTVHNSMKLQLLAPIPTE